MRWVYTKTTRDGECIRGQSSLVQFLSSQKVIHGPVSVSHRFNWQGFGGFDRSSPAISITFADGAIIVASLVGGTRS